MSHQNLKYFTFIVAMFVCTLLVSNIVATKIVNFGEIGPFKIVADGGALMFPVAYIVGDVLTEVYGYRYARQAIWIGFASMVFATLWFTLVRFLPADPSYADQSAYESVLGMVPVVVIASLVAYLFGEFLNSFVLAKLKLRTRGKWLGLRLVSSTVIGQFADTAIFCGIMAVGFGMTLNDFLGYFLLGWAFKTAVEIVMLPVTYRVIAWLKRHENMEYFDTDTDFTPLTLSLSK